MSDEHFDLLEEPCEEEEDMLDLATCLTSTSRLGCQIILSKELEGMEASYRQAKSVKGVLEAEVPMYMYMYVHGCMHIGQGRARGRGVRAAPKGGEREG